MGATECLSEGARRGDARRGVALPLPAAGEENFVQECEKYPKLTVFPVPLRFFGRATRMDIEIFGTRPKMKTPPK